MKKLILAFGLFLFIPFAVAYSCDSGGRYCKDMKSCEEARFYLNQCGIDKLDRDGDGIPCENVCGKGKKEKTKNNDDKNTNKPKSKKSKQ